MHDTLGYVENDPMHRQYHHGQLTFSLVYAYSENYVLPISHDEVVHGKGSLLRKMPGDRWQQLANLRAFLAYMWAHPGKQLLFMGSEFGQESEWAEGRELDWWLLDNADHRGVHSLVRDMNGDLQGHRGALVAGQRPGRLRLDRRRTTPATTCSASSARRRTPARGRWSAWRTSPPYRTTATGSGCRRPARGRRCSTPTPTCTPAPGSATSATVQAEEGAHHGQPASATVTVPPLATLWLRPS